ncbi:MAG TPA: type II toxin-antitoxin system VapC family toxin [Bryobacteraceae bacterium]|nr:type II toxin-antitoxin system VapC family toxin [Bryobacteraceae bacterium]
MDTNIVLLAMAAPERLSAAVRAAVKSGPNVLSVVSYWEVTLKAAKGKLIEVGDPLSWWQAALSDFAATALPLRSEHVAEIWNLPAIHQDPFDRALIAQAIAEGLKFVTTDAEIGQYAGERLRVVR